MLEAAQLSDAKRRLLTKYLRGKMEVRSATQAIPRRASDGPIPLSYVQEQVSLYARMAPDLMNSGGSCNAAPDRAAVVPQRWWMAFAIAVDLKPKIHGIL